MEEQTNKIDWKRLLITTAIVLLASAVTGGTTYYVLNSNFQKERGANKRALTSQETELKKQTNQTRGSKSGSQNTVNVVKPIGKNIRDFSIQQISTVIDNHLSLAGKGPSIADGGYSLGTVTYADLDNNRRDYALVPIIASGSGVIQTLYTIKVSDSVLAVQTVNAPSTTTGHNKFTYSNGKLIETYPVYNQGDPNCCPSGGNKIINYTWDGDSFNGAN